MFKWVGPYTNSRKVLIAPRYKKIKINTVKDMLKYNTVKDMLKYNIGTVREDVCEQLLVSKGISKSLLKPVSKPYMNAKKLKYSRIDIWAYDEIVANWIFKKNGINPKDYEVVYVLKDNLGKYFGFNRNIPDEIIITFQKALDKLKEEGKVQGIIDHYLK